MRGTTRRRLLVAGVAAAGLGSVLAGCAARPPAPVGPPGLRVALPAPPADAVLLRLLLELPGEVPDRAIRLRVRLQPPGDGSDAVEIGQMALYPPRQGGEFLFRVDATLRGKLGAGGLLRVEPFDGVAVPAGWRASAEWRPEPR